MNITEAIDLISPDIRELSAYHLEPADVETKLNQNENPYDWPAPVKEAVARFVRERPWNRYPDFIPVELKSALASFAGVSPAQVIVGNGSNEMLMVLLLACGATSRTVITCQPCFTVYSLLSRGLGYTEVRASLDESLLFNINAILAASRSAPHALMILNSPNNPVGCSLSRDQLHTILDAHRGIVVLDQAYVEFGGYNALPMLQAYPNLIITRTFSKAMAGAGLRIGYMIGAAELIGEINKIKLPYNINFFSAYVATTLLEQSDLIAQRIEDILHQRARLEDVIDTRTKLRRFASDANFCLVRSADKDRLFAHLQSNGILVRDVSRYPMLQGCLRLSVGSATETDRLIAALDSAS